ncbi:MAG: hypothetical protein QOE55_7490 [Acidobacteriaceae bacterium]|jgi:hypothetical protein|nr:hypothetical protein [Acidobacteriaceae bacterium]
MRSELVIGAMTYISNRYLITRLAARATRKFRRPNTRIQDTTNDVFERLLVPTQKQPFGMAATCSRHLS